MSTVGGALGTRPGAQPRVEAARRAVAVVFILNGLAFASLFARMPDLRTGLGLTPGQLGLLLLCMSAGTLIALPSAGFVVAHLGPRRAVLAGAVVAAAALVGLGAGLSAALVPAVAVAMFFYGVGVSTWDVSMNVEAADVERRLGRPVMPRFHAGFSIGSVTGAGLGALLSHQGVSLASQLAGTAVVALALVALALRGFLPLAPRTEADLRRSPLLAWKEPRTLAIGLVVMAFALCEGIANDWLALGLVDGYDVSPAGGALGFGAFVAAMTAGRMVGGAVTERFGRTITLRATAALVVTGVLVVVLSPVLAGAYVGAVIWGLGASLGFPMGMTAAGDDPQHAAARLSVVSSIGYAAFLGGPPLVGWLADHVGVLDSLTVAVAAALVGALVSGAVRERRLSEAPDGAH